MKTAMKLNRKELVSLYEKSNDQVKKTLRAEFGDAFFSKEESKPEIRIAPKKSMPSAKARRFDWQMLFDFTPMVRILGYAFLVSLVLKFI